MKPAKSPTPKIEAWRSETEWVWIRSHHQLSHIAQVVKMEYESLARGIEPAIERRITQGGVWVWKPDADNIMNLQGLASCKGQDMGVKRPFFTCGAPRSAAKGRPAGPPSSEA